MQRHHHSRTFSIATIVLATALASAGGCTRRPHTRPDYGVANRAFFDRQAQAASRGSAQGQDSEEASAIHQRYRESLGKRGAEPRNDPRSSVMILEGDRHAAPNRR